MFDSTIAVLDDKTLDAMDALVFTCGYTLTKGCGHWLLNFEVVLKNGFSGIEKHAQKSSTNSTLPTPRRSIKSRCIRRSS